MIQIIPVPGIPEVQAGDDLAQLVVTAARNLAWDDGDVLVVTQKVVSKAEGRMVPATQRSEAIGAETRRVLRRSGSMAIVETHHGFVCANAGVDESNVPRGTVALLPKDPDASARRLRARIKHLTGRTIGVIISDTFGRAWRLGQTDVAIGLAGFSAFSDYIGKPDNEGRIMHATRLCVADEIAGAAELVMGKTERVCAALVKGVPIEPARAAASQIVRPPEQDLFR